MGAGQRDLGASGAVVWAAGIGARVCSERVRAAAGVVAARRRAAAGGCAGVGGGASSVGAVRAEAVAVDGCDWRLAVAVWSEGWRARGAADQQRNGAALSEIVG